MPKLSISKEEAFERFDERASELKKIKGIDSDSPENFEQAKILIKRWSDYFRIFIVQIFSSDFFLREYDSKFSDISTPVIFYPGKLRNTIHRHIDERINYINTIVQRLGQLEKDGIPISSIQIGHSRIENSLDIFLSHSNKEKKIAGEIKNNLEQLVRCDIFLAHDDLEGGEVWAEGLRKRVKDCNLFIPIISREYHRANYTDQEAGIAYAYDKPMLPISIDGTIPYGFMSKYQPVKVTKLDRNNFREIAKQIISRGIPEEKRIDHYIELLQNAFTYNCANFLADLLPTDYSYSKEQINKLAKILNENGEVRESYSAGPHLSFILKKNRSLIDSELEKIIKSFLE